MPSLIAKRGTHKANVTAGDEKRSAGNGNQADFPEEGETEGESDYDSGHALNDGAESDASKTVDLLGVLAQLGSQRASLKGELV